MHYRQRTSPARCPTTSAARRRCSSRRSPPRRSARSRRLARCASLRARFTKGEITAAEYEAGIDAFIGYTVGVQDGLGLDMLVHGESERTDMVEYFAQKMTGFAFTQYAWVQSFGSRYVRPPDHLRRCVAARSDDCARISRGAVVHAEARQRDAHRAGDDPQLVVSAHRHPAPG